MPRTPSQLEAIARDGEWCLWSTWAKGERRPGGPVHHLARRQAGGDVPDLCVVLAETVHRVHHNGGEPTTTQLLDLMQMVYGWDLRAKYPRFFGGR